MKVDGPVTMPPIDHAPWLLGHRDSPLVDWSARMAITRDAGVQTLPGPYFVLPHSGVVGRIHVGSIHEGCSTWIPNWWQLASSTRTYL